MRAVPIGVGQYVDEFPGQANQDIEQHRQEHNPPSALLWTWATMHQHPPRGEEQRNQQHPAKGEEQRGNRYRAGGGLERGRCRHHTSIEQAGIDDDAHAEALEADQAAYTRAVADLKARD